MKEKQILNYIPMSFQCLIEYRINVTIISSQRHKPYRTNIVKPNLTVSQRMEEQHRMKWKKEHGTREHQNRQPWPWLWPWDNSMWLHGRIDRRAWIRFEGLR